MLVLVNDVLALATGVPDSNGFVKRAGDDLSVIWGKSNRENIFGVSDKFVDGLSSCNLPEANSAIP